MTQEDRRDSEGARALRPTAEAGLRWLFEEALPVWAAHGLNASGGFVDRLGERYQPTDAPLRLRVQARQTYVFAQAGRLGWTGPWREAVEHGLAFLLRARRDDGLLPHVFAADGEVLDPQPDLYDQAFALFAYAHAFGVLGAQDAHEAALRLVRTLQTHAEPTGGFRELRPGASPLQSNPQMHLMEAFLAWRAVDPGGPWGELADAQDRLCRQRLVDPATLALREFFEDGWRPAPAPLGDRTEPGHHYEWAWLLRRNGATDDLPLRLCGRAERLGVDGARKVAVDVISIDGRVLEAGARLWPQTERLRVTADLTASGAPGPWAERALQAFDGLFAYIRPAPPGRWRDRMQPDGAVIPEPAPASSLYHIVGALSGLAEAVGLRTG